MPPILNPRALNRATLARQLLLQRERLSAVEAIERVLGLQAQLARPPYMALWSRLENFDREELNQALQARTVVRATLMRCTLHMVSARDYQQFRATLQPVLDGAMQGVLKQRKADVDLEPVLAIARTAFETPHTFEAVRDQLQARFPEADERAMGYAVRTQLPLVQVPTDAPWGFPATSCFTASAGWLGKGPEAEARVHDLFRRYLAAFGPASVADFQRWTGLSALKKVLDGQRDDLVVFKDERGRELFDLPDAPRPDADVEAPVRFLPDFDQLILAFDDRSRILDDAYKGRIYNKANLRVLPSFLVDGRVAGSWKLDGTKTKPVLTITPFEALTDKDREALREEGDRLLRFAEPQGKSFDVQVE